MPYFIRVGAIPENASGVGARGYHIFRRKTTVTTVWGPIEVRPGRRMYWVFTTQHRRLRYSSIPAAKRGLAELLEHRVTRGYNRLPSGAKILRHAKSHASTPRR